MHAQRLEERQRAGALLGEGLDGLPSHELERLLRIHDEARRRSAPAAAARPCRSPLAAAIRLAPI